MFVIADFTMLLLTWFGTSLLDVPLKKKGFTAVIVSHVHHITR
jgi:hypothetical protein